MFDFIGDIHGHADKLQALLTKLGYTNKNGVYSHPERKAFFVGDFIDRGPKIRETLSIVRKMVESDNAIAVMGNHEYNALCFHFQETDGGHLRKHLIKNIIQHYETLKQFQNMQEEYEDYLEWFKTLPLFYETETFRAVHPCWDVKNIALLKTVLTNDRLADETIYQSVKNGTPFHEAIEDTLKGKEIKMPPGMDFTDKDGTLRTEIRIKWWDNPKEVNYQQISVEPLDNLPETPVDISLLKNADYYVESEKPFFFGHYWLKGQPALYRNNICCLDYSVAKDGLLSAYRFDGEKTLNDEKFVYV
jgi:Calcineurin-like phosphoesterase